MSKKKKRKSPNGSVVNVAGMTDKGLVRTNNEDQYLIEKIWEGDAVLAVVIDGLGGYEGGEVAAGIAKEKIRDFIVNSRNGTGAELLKQAVTTANNAIYEASCANPRYQKMGCVLTAAIIDIKNKLVSMAHVGDTRMYGFRNGILEKLSHDHSLVGRMEEMGDLTEMEAMNHVDRNLVDRVLGHEMHLSSDKGFIESQVFELHPDTTFLLCSDGLTDLIATSTIKRILGCPGSLKEKTQSLVKASLDAGGKDNITVVLVFYQGEQKPRESVVNRGRPERGDLSKKDKNDLNERPSKMRIAALVFIGFAVGFLLGVWISKKYGI